MEARSVTTMTLHPRQEGDAEPAKRWLVAGDAPWLDGLGDALPQIGGDGGAQENVRLVQVPSFLAALGDLGHEPADVVIGPAALLDHSGGAESTARALRTLAPNATLLLVADDAHSAVADAAMSAGFNASLSPPVTAQKLARALEGESPAKSSEAHEPDEANANAEPAPSPSLTTDVAAGETPGEELGDVDLIERILGGSGVRATAMHVVRARLGIDQIGIADSEAAAPAGHVCSRIALHGRDFGVLHAPVSPDDAPPITPDALAGWAGWLAHWLALDEQMSLLKDLSMRDALTGVWNRRYFDRFLKRILDWAGRERSQVTLLVFDIDDFKLYNDRYGHAAGDDILRECSRLMLSVVREHDVVARIGGDEFAVIFWDADPQAPRQPNSRHPEDVVSAATRFQRAICSHQFPKLLNEAPGTLTISGGLASFPWDGRTPQELLDKADEMAMQSKRQGKNAIKFGPGAQRVCQSIQRD